MQGSTRYFARTAIAVTLAFSFCSQVTLAGNRLVLKKGIDNSIDVELSNIDRVAGAQFSISARGGLVLFRFEGSNRLAESGIAVYQALNGDSTLNVVLLAPPRSSLPTGEGLIGKISYKRVGGQNSDSVRVVLQRVVICDAGAQLLDVAIAHVSWPFVEQTELSGNGVVLEQNFPNPFNPSTTIAYKLRKPSHVHLAIYDLAGRMVNLLVDEDQLAGPYAVSWNVQDGRSAHLASGMYVARLAVEGEVATKKMILTK